MRRECGQTTASTRSTEIRHQKQTRFFNSFEKRFLSRGAGTGTCSGQYFFELVRLFPFVTFVFQHQADVHDPRPLHVHETVQGVVCQIDTALLQVRGDTFDVLILDVFPPGDVVWVRLVTGAAATIVTTASATAAVTPQPVTSFAIRPGFGSKQ